MSYEFDFSIKKKEFYSNLWTNYQVTEDNISTHTSIGDPPGAWHIADEYLDYFYDIYGDICFKFNIGCHLTERHKKVSPILIDLDFRYDINHSDRLFNIEFIKKIVKLYNKIIKDTYEEVPNKYLESYVLLKEHPIRDNDKFKDGIHIVYPYLVTKPEIQKWFRKTLIRDYKNELNEIFDKIHCTNDYPDIFDDKVIYDTNWQLYGSKKPNNIPYKLEYILDSETHIIKNKYLDDTLSINKEKIKLFSIRNKCETKLILNTENLKMDKWLKDNSEKFEKQVQNYRTTKIGPKRSITDIKIYGKNGDKENLNYIEDLVENCLSDTRSDSFASWIKIGILLHNIDYSLLDTWIIFSKKSPKYKEGECQEKWDRLPVSSKKNQNTISPELGMGTLINWCKEDNLDKYNEIRNKYYKSATGNSSLYKLLYKSAGAAHTDVANVIYKYFNGFGLSEENRFMCFNIAKKLWCEYKAKQHRWIEDTEEDPGHCIRQTFENEIYRLYEVDYNTQLTSKISVALSEGDAEAEENLKKHKDKISKLTNQLKINSYRDTLLKECGNRFYLKGCRDLLDTQLDLIHFTNGVYDLETNIFRDGRPSDNISLTTNLEYVEYTFDSPEIIDLQNIISQILPVAPVREYFLHILSSCLSGKVYFEKFFVLTGSGSNGKSKLIELIQNTLGDYYHQMNVAALCSKRGNSQSADPELAMLRGRRFVAFQEPSKDEPINVGKLKEWTGGDTIQTRELYKGPIKFKSQAKMFLICNDIPDVHSDDDGTWRRLTVINFPSKFIPRSEFTGRDYEYERINNMNEKLDELREPFIWFLLQYYKKFQATQKKGGLSEPQEIIDATNHERKKNNPIKQFIDDRIVFSQNRSDKFNIQDIYTVFRNYMTDSGHNPKFLPKRPDFQQKFNIEYVNIIKKNTNKTLEIIKQKHEWNNVKYLIDNTNTENETLLMIDDESEDEYTNTLELINMDDIEHSDSD